MIVPLLAPFPVIGVGLGRHLRTPPRKLSATTRYDGGPSVLASVVRVLKWSGGGRAGGRELRRTRD